MLGSGAFTDKVPVADPSQALELGPIPGTEWVPPDHDYCFYNNNSTGGGRSGITGGSSSHWSGANCSVDHRTQEEYEAGLQHNTAGQGPAGDTHYNSSGHGSGFPNQYSPVPSIAAIECESQPYELRDQQQQQSCDLSSQNQQIQSQFSITQHQLTPGRVRIPTAIFYIPEDDHVTSNLWTSNNGDVGGSGSGRLVRGGTVGGTPAAAGGAAAADIVQSHLSRIMGNVQVEPDSGVGHGAGGGGSEGCYDVDMDDDVSDDDDGGFHQYPVSYPPQGHPLHTQHQQRSASHHFHYRVPSPPGASWELSGHIEHGGDRPNRAQQEQGGETPGVLYHNPVAGSHQAAPGSHHCGGNLDSYNGYYHSRQQPPGHQPSSSTAAAGGTGRQYSTQNHLQLTREEGARALAEQQWEEGIVEGHQHQFGHQHQRTPSFRTDVRYASVKRTNRDWPDEPVAITGKVNAHVHEAIQGPAADDILNHTRCHNGNNYENVAFHHGSDFPPHYKDFRGGGNGYIYSSPHVVPPSPNHHRPHNPATLTDQQRMIQVEYRGDYHADYCRPGSINHLSAATAQQRHQQGHDDNLSASLEAPRTRKGEADYVNWQIVDNHRAPSYGYQYSVSHEGQLADGLIHYEHSTQELSYRQVDWEVPQQHQHLRGNMESVTTKRTHGQLAQRQGCQNISSKPPIARRGQKHPDYTSASLQNNANITHQESTESSISNDRNQDYASGLEPNTIENNPRRRSNSPTYSHAYKQIFTNIPEKPPPSQARSEAVPAFRQSPRVNKKMYREMHNFDSDNESNNGDVQDQRYFCVTGSGMQGNNVRIEEQTTLSNVPSRKLSPSRVVFSPQGDNLSQQNHHALNDHSPFDPLIQSQHTVLQQSPRESPKKQLKGILRSPAKQRDFVPEGSFVDRAMHVFEPMASTPREKRTYESILMKPVKENLRTPLDVAKTYESPERQPSEQKHKLEGARKGYLHMVPNNPPWPKSTVLDAVFEEKKRRWYEKPCASPTSGLMMMVDIDIGQTSPDQKQSTESLKQRIKRARPRAPDTSAIEKRWKSTVPLKPYRSQGNLLDRKAMGADYNNDVVSSGADNPTTAGTFTTAADLRRVQSLGTLPSQFFSENRSYASLIETDLDTGVSTTTPLVHQTDLDGSMLAPNTKTQSLSNLSKSPSMAPEEEGVGEEGKYKSMDNMLEDDGISNQLAQNHEKRKSMLKHALPKHGSEDNASNTSSFDADPERSMSAGELRISESLTKLSIPGWYKSGKKAIDLKHTKQFKLPGSGDTLNSSFESNYSSDGGYDRKPTASPRAQYKITQAKRLNLNSPGQPRHNTHITSDGAKFDLPSSKLKQSHVELKPIETKVVHSTPPSTPRKQSAKEAYHRLKAEAETQKELLNIEDYQQSTRRKSTIVVEQAPSETIQWYEQDVQAFEEEAEFVTNDQFLHPNELPFRRYSTIEVDPSPNQTVEWYEPKPYMLEGVDGELVDERVTSQRDVLYPTHQQTDRRPSHTVVIEKIPGQEAHWFEQKSNVTTQSPNKQLLATGKFPRRVSTVHIEKTPAQLTEWYGENSYIIPESPRVSGEPLTNTIVDCPGNDSGIGPSPGFKQSKQGNGNSEQTKTYDPGATCSALMKKMDLNDRSERTQLIAPDDAVVRMLNNLDSSRREIQEKAHHITTDLSVPDGLLDREQLDPKECFPVLSYVESPNTQRKVYDPNCSGLSSSRENVRAQDGNTSLENQGSGGHVLSSDSGSMLLSPRSEQDDYDGKGSSRKTGLFRMLRRVTTPRGSMVSVNTSRTTFESSYHSEPEDQLDSSKLTNLSGSQTINPVTGLQGDIASLSEEAVIVKCRYPKCKKSVPLPEARETYKTCHNCYTYYCGRECRKSHWSKHKKKCLYSRVNSTCKHIIKKVHDTVEILEDLSRIARTGYMSKGRGCVLLAFSCPENAEEYLKLGVCEAEPPPGYANLADLQEEQDLIGDHQAELYEMIRTYNPDIKFVIEVMVVAGDETPICPMPRREGPSIKKCARLRLSMTTPKPAPNDSDPKKSEPETLILTALPGSEFTENMEEKKAREICFAHIQRKLRQRGVNLRQHFPDAYHKLCAYVAENKHFTPMTIYPVDGDSGKRFMCMIMPNAEAEVEWMHQPDLLDELGLATEI